jgi:hypothetical protein
MIPLSPFTFYFLLINNNNNNNNNNRAWTPKKHKGMLVLSLSFSFIFFLLLYRVSNASIAVGSFHVSCNLLLMFFLASIIYHSPGKQKITPFINPKERLVASIALREVYSL